MEQCYEKYNMIINSDKINELNINNSSVLDFVVKCKNNKYVDYEDYDTFIDKKCKRVTKKQEKYYKYEYNPQWFIKYIESSHTEIEKTNIYNITDLKIRNNCCNCISIVLYVNENVSVDILHKYLNSMATTLKITNIHLNEFVIRYYIHENVFIVIENIIRKIDEYKIDMYGKNKMDKIIEIIDIFKFLITNHQSEIYIYICDIDVIEKYRTMRFVSLMDNDVNICIIREADGYVGITDCHNIKIFSSENEHKILLLYDVDKMFKYKFKEILDEQKFKVIKNSYEIDILNYNTYNKHNFVHYSGWLNIYENIFIKGNSSLVDDIPDIFNNDEKLSFLDILAGCFGVKIKLNRDYIINTIQYLNKQLNFLISCEKLLSHKKKIYSSKLENEYTTIVSNNDINKILSEKLDNLFDNSNNQIINFIDENYLNSIDKTINLLHIGYDEIILLLLYGIFTRCNYTVDENNDNIFDYNDIKEKRKILVTISSDYSYKTVDNETIVSDINNQIKTNVFFDEIESHKKKIFSLIDKFYTEKINTSTENLIFNDTYNFVIELLVNRYGLIDNTKYISLNPKIINLPYINNKLYDYIYNNIDGGGSKFLVKKYLKYKNKN